MYFKYNFILVQNYNSLHADIYKAHKNKQTIYQKTQYDKYACDRRTVEMTHTKNSYSQESALECTNEDQ